MVTRLLYKFTGMYMRSKFNLKVVVLLLAVVLYCCHDVALCAQPGVDSEKPDSVLLEYYSRCNLRIRDSIVLPMTDTLLKMARQRKSNKMEAVALSTYLDYYYYMGNQDSIVAYTNIVKAFSKQTNQPVYYYFAWSRRLIQYYIISERNTLALYEAEKMLEEASKDQNQVGIASCYHSLSLIYVTRGRMEKAQYYRLEEAKVIEKYGLDSYNVSQLYCEIANYLSETNQCEQALKWLRKAQVTAKTKYHQVAVKIAYVTYYCVIDEMDKARETLQEVRQLFETQKELHNKIKGLYDCELRFYRKTNDHVKMLEVLALLDKVDQTAKSKGVLWTVRMKTRAQLYFQMNNTAKAAECFSLYIKNKDSIDIKNEMKVVEEFETLMNVERLNTENNELILEAQQEEIANRKQLTIILSVLFVIIILVLGTFFYRENKLNRRLKISQNSIRHKNAELIVSKAELLLAKERVEQASQMKSSFIKNMSHEIRTPLNSIVGFSQILTEVLEGDEQVMEYTAEIERNAQYLLKLITDILELSKLDSSEEPLENEEVDLNGLCIMSLDIVRAKLKEGVTLNYVSPSFAQGFTVVSNYQGLFQILSNLLHNAVKFTTKGTVTLGYSLSEIDQTATISVSDTGVGIPLKDHHSVFERFVKLNEYNQGTGLGLSIAKLVTKKLGGTLYIDSTYVDGCRFVLTIPMVPIKNIV